LLDEEVICPGFESNSPKFIFALVQVFAKRKEVHGMNDVDRRGVVKPPLGGTFLSRNCKGENRHE